VSQLPVLDGRKVVGILDESDLLLAASENPQAFGLPCRECMTERLETVAPTAALYELFPIFDAGKVVIVADNDGFHGLITRVDLLNHLRRQQRIAA
jgi:cystathionine beta-synthase